MLDVNEDSGTTNPCCVEVCNDNLVGPDELFKLRRRANLGVFGHCA
jgi:hypothetical protein